MTLTPKVQKALECIEARAKDRTWRMRADLIKDGTSIARPIEESINDLKLRRPRVRHKAEKEQLERDLQILREAAKEIEEQAAQAAPRRSA